MQSNGAIAQPQKTPGQPVENRVITLSFKLKNSEKSR